jgi:hypothetical protein
VSVLGVVILVRLGESEDGVSELGRFMDRFILKSLEELNQY